MEIPAAHARHGDDMLPRKHGCLQTAHGDLVKLWSSPLQLRHWLVAVLGWLPSHNRKGPPEPLRGPGLCEGEQWHPHALCLMEASPCPLGKMLERAQAADVEPIVAAVDLVLEH